MDASFLRVWPGSGSGPPFLPSTLPHLGAQCRVLTRHGPAVLCCFSGRGPWSRVPLTLHSLLAVSLALASSPSQLPSVDCRRPQPAWSIFSCESHDLRWLGRPLLYPLRSRFEFLSSSSITCPPNSPALSRSASAALVVQPLHRYASSNTNCIRTAFDRIDAGSAAPEPRSARPRRFPLPLSSSSRRRSALSGPVCSLSVASDRACI